MIQRLKEALARRQRHHSTATNRIPSAVLLPLYYKEGQYHLLLTQRTDKVREHKGQISFPGGVYEEKDQTLLDTALRESTEEIGLLSKDVEILGALDDEGSMTTNYIISPFVALVPCPYRFQINIDEIKEIIEIPISELLKIDYTMEKIRNPDGELVISYTYEYQDKIIWGATARILNEFLDIFVEATAQG